MKYHPLARTTVYLREQLAKSVVEGRLSLKEAAAEFKLSRQSAGKWVKRYRELGVEGLADRTSRPHRLAHQSPVELVQRVEKMRREGWTGLRIAKTTGLSSATVSRMLTRLRLNKKHMIESKPPPLRYERAAPGDLLHLDIKKFARIVKAGHRITGDLRDETRGAGWEFLYVAVDDHSRIAFTAMYPDEKAVSSADFLTKAAAYFQRFGIVVRRVITDNGPCFLANLFRDTCRALGITPKRTRHYRPQTNGKAERFIRTLLGGWAYGALYRNSNERAAALDGWLWYYNHQRRHSALGHKPPIARLDERTNVLRTYT
jgi:transposase InsO family protein